MHLLYFQFFPCLKASWLVVTFLFLFFRTAVHLRNVELSPSFKTAGQFDIRFTTRSTISAPARKLNFHYEERTENMVKSIEYIKDNMAEYVKVFTFEFQRCLQGPHRENGRLIDKVGKKTVRPVVNTG